jgi:predicted RNase H-like HicB family nuclease
MKLPHGYIIKGALDMEKMITIHLERLPEGFYLATSDDIQGLVAQGRTVAETLEIARDVARKLIEEQGYPTVNLGAIGDSLEYPLIVGS